MDKWNLINRGSIPVVYTQGQDLESFDLERFDTEMSAYIDWGGNPGSWGFGSAFGLAAITYQGFITPSSSGEIAWGLGGSLVVPTNTGERFATDKWSAGPAVVMITTPGKWLLGAIAQNIWSFAGSIDAADVNIFTT